MIVVEPSSRTSSLATHAVLRFAVALAACGFVQLVELGLCFAVGRTVDPAGEVTTGLLAELSSGLMQFASGNSLPSVWLLPLVSIAMVGIALKAGIFVHSLHHRTRTLNKPLLALTVAVTGIGAGVAASVGHTMWTSTIAAEHGPDSLAAVTVASSITAVLRGQATNVGLLGTVIFLVAQGQPKTNLLPAPVHLRSPEAPSRTAPPT